MPLGPATLSRRLPVIGLVGHYPTNYLIGRDPLLRRQLAKQRPAFTSSGCPKEAVWGISTPFGALSPTGGQVSHVLLRRPPVYSSPEGEFRPRLAWLRHAASVSPEPGSNPPLEFDFKQRNSSRNTLLFCQRTRYIWKRIKYIPYPIFCQGYF